jgi:cobalamin biosynthesis protein CobD/CbiB
MAGLLGVQLEKPGTYRLSDDVTALDVTSIRIAERVVLVTAALGLLASMTLAWLLERPR